MGNEKLCSNDFTDLCFLEKSYDADCREDMYLYDCRINGKESRLVMTVQYHDDGESFHISAWYHGDLMRSMLQEEIYKLEERLIQEFEYRSMSQRIGASFSMDELNDVANDLLERQNPYIDSVRELLQREWDGKKDVVLSAEMLGRTNLLKPYISVDRYAVEHSEDYGVQAVHGGNLWKDGDYGVIFEWTPLPFPDIKNTMVDIKTIKRDPTIYNDLVKDDSRSVQYSIDFTDDAWKKKLENAMYVAFVEYYGKEAKQLVMGAEGNKDNEYGLPAGQEEQSQAAASRPRRGR